MDKIYFNENIAPKFIETICIECDGSGEGSFDGSICYFCHGLGIVLEEKINELENKNDYQSNK